MTKRLIQVLALLTVVALTSVPVVAQSPKWRHLHGGLLGGVAFVDEENGFVAGDSRIHWSDDGGDTWNAALINDSGDASIRVALRGMFFLDLDTGWVCGDGGVILRSVEGEDGKEWNDANPGTGTPNEGRILDDCGELAQLHSIFMFNSQDGWVVGKDGAIAVTMDGWETWTSKGPDVSSFFDCESVTDVRDAYDIHFFSDPESEEPFSKGILLSEYRLVFTTIDGGETWSQLDIVQDAPEAACPEIPGGHNHEQNNLELWDIAFEDPSDPTSPGYVAAGIGFNNGYVYRTTGMQTTGTYANSWVDTWAQMQCFEFLTPSATPVPGTTCGPSTQYSMVLLDSGGDPIRPLSAGYAGECFVHELGDTNFDPCECSDESPFPCSANSLTLVQQDTDVTSVNPLQAKPVGFAGARVSGTEACFVGSFGHILKFSNGGSPEVEEVGSPYFVRLDDGEFLSSTRGCVVGQSYAILRTTDGGATWGEPELSFNYSPGGYFNGIAFSSDGEHGVAAGSGGFIAITDGTTDPEESWTDEVSVPSYVGDLNAVAFAPGTSTAYAVSATGNVIKSTDNGETWAYAADPDSSSSAALHGVAFATADRGYVVGEGAGVWSTSNGGDTWTSVTVTGASGETFFDVETWGAGAPAVLVAEDGGVFEKLATGSSFTKLTLGSLSVTQHLIDVAVLIDGSNVNLRIGGYGGVVLVRDAGTWTQPRSETSDRLVKLDFLSADEGFAIGGGFVILKYDDE